MSIPYPRPENAGQARGNMIYWAEIAESTAVAGAAIMPSMASVEKAKMWAAIALTLPEVEYAVLTGDDQPITVHEYMPVLEPWPNQPGADEPPLEPLNRATLGALPDRVPAHVYDVLRVLAVRYLDTTSSGQALVTEVEIEMMEGQVLRVRNNEDGSVTVSGNPM